MPIDRTKDPVHVTAASTVARTLLLCAVAATTMSSRGQELPTNAEKASAGAAFKRADADNDGLLTRDESAHLPAVYAHFDELDSNHDGVLSFDEFIAALQIPS